MKKSWIAALLCCAVVGVSPAWAQADDYPSRPVKFLLPLGPGSGGDINTRVLADAFSKVSGGTAIVENRPGASMALGTAVALNSPADGYTIVVMSPSAPVLNPLVMKDLPYDPALLKPVLHLTNNVGVLVTAPNSPFNSLKDVLDAARKKPQSISIGVYGNTYRLGKEVLAKAAGVEFNDIPYKGFGPTVTDVIGGTTDVALVDLGGAVPLIQSGKIKALAVGSNERVPVVADIPTVRESGFPDYNLYIFVGYAIHKDTPEPIAQKIESLLQKAAHDPAVAKALENQPGTLFVGDDGKAFAETIEKEKARAKEFTSVLSGG